MLTLNESQNTDREIGCFFHIAYSESEPCIMHTHEYYELFLTDAEPLLHHINGETVTLLPRSLVFVRPSDCHTFSPVGDRLFSFSNLAFSKETAETLFAFLGMGFPLDTLLSSPLPPTVILEEHRYRRLHYDFCRLNTVPLTDKGQRQYFMRELIYRMLRYFYESDLLKKTAEMPEWLANFCHVAAQPKTFNMTREELVRLSGKSHEYLSRCFRKHLGTTISQYIWDARLTYAANLLMHSYLDITDICFESGFSNVSWFYTQFRKKFGISPRAFRIDRHPEMQK